jgi:apolipoprotein N-acyltransferase
MPDGTSLLPMICYEDILPAFVRTLWRAAGPAEVLINVTNDSWYGDTQQPLIHLALATFRSIETRRAMIRSTNTGISAIVDPVGRIVARTGQWTQETLVAEVPVIRDGGSPLYMRVGDAYGWLSGLAAAALFLRGRLRRRP